MDTFIRHTSKKASRPSPDMLCPQETFFLLIYLFSVEIRHTAAIIIMIPMSAGRLSPSRNSRQPISSATPGSLEVSIDARPAETLLSPSINKLHGITVHVTLIAARMSG